MTQNVPTEQISQAAESLQPVEPSAAVNHALLSVLVPGVGQLAQRRPVAAALQFATVAAYVASAYAAGGGRALWLALLWNAWSAVDAYWHAPR